MIQLHDIYPDEFEIENMIQPKLSISHHVPGSRIGTATFSYKSNQVEIDLYILDLLVASGGEDG